MGLARCLAIAQTEPCRVALGFHRNKRRGVWQHPCGSFDPLGSHNVVSFARKKTGSIAIMRFDDEVAQILKDLPGNGPLFPYLRTVRSGDRATEFHQRCVGLNIKGVTVHSYRYAWAERAKTVGYPERFAQEALGHNSKAVHRAYAKRALIKLPSLEEYEVRAGQAIAANEVS